MPLTRRDFLKLTGLVAASAALAACRPLYELAGQPPLTAWPALSTAEWLALNRLTYGPRPAERARLAEIGLPAWLEEQLAPENLDDLPCHLRLRNLDTLPMTSQQLADQCNQLFDDVDRQTIPAQLRQGSLLRQVYSRRQLFERLVEFWNDHFNIATDKGDCFYLKTVDDRTVTRAHALGSFRELLGASAHSPAMLTYLDNQANRKGAPNENYARELMELHTLGVDGGYTQGDVMELARCLTGWGVKEKFWTGEFTFAENQHDDGAKQVLGLTLLPGGLAEAESVLDCLAQHPAAARFVAFKLARRFLADDPPAEIVRKAAAAFERTHGDLRTVLRVILLDGLPLAQPKYRRPVDFVAAALRLLDAESDCGPAVQDFLLRMGQLPFNWPTPDGYPDRADAWQGNLMPRWQFAFALARNELANTTLDMPALLAAHGATDLPASLDALASLLLGAPLPAAKRDTLLAALHAAGASDDDILPVFTGGLLASPAFQWR
jgi:hypothetical protein